MNASLISGLSSPGGIAISGSDLFVTNAWRGRRIHDFGRDGERLSDLGIGIPSGYRGVRISSVCRGQLGLDWRIHNFGRDGERLADLGIGRAIWHRGSYRHSCHPRTEFAGTPLGRSCGARSSRLARTQNCVIWSPIALASRNYQGPVPPSNDPTVASIPLMPPTAFARGRTARPSPSIPAPCDHAQRQASDDRAVQRRLDPRAMPPAARRRAVQAVASIPLVKRLRGV